MTVQRFPCLQERKAWNLLDRPSAIFPPEHLFLCFSPYFTLQSLRSCTLNHLSSASSKHSTTSKVLLRRFVAGKALKFYQRRKPL